MLGALEFDSQLCWVVWGKMYTLFDLQFPQSTWRKCGSFEAAVRIKIEYGQHQVQHILISPLNLEVILPNEDTKI